MAKCLLPTPPTPIATSISTEGGEGRTRRIGFRTIWDMPRERGPQRDAHLARTLTIHHSGIHLRDEMQIFFPRASVLVVASLKKVVVAGGGTGGRRGPRHLLSRGWVLVARRVRAFVGDAVASVTVSGGVSPDPLWSRRGQSGCWGCEASHLVWSGRPQPVRGSWRYPPARAGLVRRVGAPCSPAGGVQHPAWWTHR